MSKLPRVLVVEDAADTRLVLNVALGGEFTVLGAGSAEEGLGILQNEAVDIALVDINLPGMSGVEFLNAWRADPVHAARPIVALTTIAARSQLAAFVEAGFDRALGKPVMDPHRLAQISSRTPRRVGELSSRAYLGAANNSSSVPVLMAW